MPWVEMYVFKSFFYSAASEMPYFSHCRRDVQNPHATHLKHLKRPPPHPHPRVRDPRIPVVVTACRNQAPDPQPDHDWTASL